MQVVSMFSVPLERWYVMTKACCTAVLVLGVLVWASPNAQAQTKKISYAITELSPWVSSNRCWARNINDLGQVVGGAYIDGTTFHACIWERVAGQWTIRDLGAPANYIHSNGNDINDFGEVAVTCSGTPDKAFFYGENGLIELVSGEYGSSWTSDINYFGDVCGVTDGEVSLGQACLWERAGGNSWTFSDLGVMTGCYQSRENDLNDSRQVVGYSWVDENRFWRACLWERNEEGQWTVTFPAGDLRSTAHYINNSGQIVGNQYIDDTTSYACLWERKSGQWTATNLQALAPDLYGSIGYDINGVGQVVGYARLAGTTTGVGFLYQNGVMRDLNSFLPVGSGWSTLYLASGINDQGQIAGQGYNTAGVQHAFLMDTRAVTYSYTSTGSAVAIKDKSTASKAMTLTDANSITDLNVSVNLYHTRYADLKFELIGPNNVARVLCNAGAVTGSGTKTLVFDDEGAVGTIKPFQPLSYYDLTSTQGKWTLRISDTVKNSKTGSFASFTLDVVPVMPAL
jgi:probable HAF family extracellular repeat protein